MTALADLLQRGGPAVAAIMVLAVILYSRCFTVLLRLRRAAVAADLPAVRSPRRQLALQLRQVELREGFRQDRLALGAMIAAAPLLGLLGTVSGMVRTFDSLAAAGGQKSMEGLAGGISEVLTATESGLAVAIPALALVYCAHRLLLQRLQELNAQEPRERGGIRA